MWRASCEPEAGAERGSASRSHEAPDPQFKIEWKEDPGPTRPGALTSTRDSPYAADAEGAAGAKVAFAFANALTPLAIHPGGLKEKASRMLDFSITRSMTLGV